MKFNRLSDLLVSISPSVISKIRGKQRETSTRDKKQIIKQVEHIEFIVDELGYEIELKKKRGQEKRKENTRSDEN